MLHATMIVEAVRAGKHVICEKPFAGYFGRGDDKTPIGKHVPKSLMYERVLEEMEETCAAIKSSGRLFMYAEDWVYAPAVTKTVEILNATKDKILFMKAEESHSGSHAAHAADWSMTGGGSLIRMGCHPLSTALFLKQVEARARGERIAVSAVTADVGNVAAGLPPKDHAFIKSHPIDVEDWSMLTLTFSDGTKSTILSGDVILGGVRNIIETYTSGGSLFANITPNNHLTSYLTDEEKLAGVYITEKVDRKTGWQFICLEEEWTRGYLQEILRLHGMRDDRPAAARRSGPSLRNHQGQLRRLLVRRGRPAYRAVDLCGRSPRLLRAVHVISSRTGRCSAPIDD